MQEIQVFTIILKTEALTEEILQIIDKAIPSPILFHLIYNDKSRYKAAYKRPSEADKSKWVVSSYFETEWISDCSDKMELPVVLSMGALYQAILKNIIPLTSRKNETLNELVMRVDNLHIKERRAAKIKCLIKKRNSLIAELS